MDPDFSSDVRSRGKSLSRSGWILAAIFLGLGVAGCGGGSGGGPADPPAGSAPPPLPPPANNPPAGDVSVTITARDVFGTPVSGASIMLLESRGTGLLEVGIVTDSNGRASLTGRFEQVYAAIVSTADLKGSSYEPSRPGEGRVEFAVTLHPLSGLTPGIGRLSVTGGSADGRQLEFSARLYVVAGNIDGTLEEWNLSSVAVLPCTPSAANDATPFAADCVAGPQGFDAPFTGTVLTQNWVDPGSASHALAIALLVDQGARVAINDPAHRRLLAAKYLDTRLDANDQMALAAFAADDATTGSVALLPDQPVTLFPIASPAFTSERNALFSTMDSLATLEGGRSPLHAAIARMIEFTTASAPAASRRAVAAFASGAGDCATQAECRTAQEELRDASTSAGVPVFVVALSDTFQPVDIMKLGAFAQAGQGAVFWARDAAQVPTVFGRIPEILDERHGAVDITVRLESSLAGAFTSGKTVAGTLQVIVCPWDCTDYVDVPFALHIP